MTAVGDDVCVPPCVACSVSAYLGLCLFLPLYDYAIRNRIFGDGVVVVQVVVLFAEVMYVEFPHGVHMFVMCVMFIVFSVVPCAWFSRRGGGGLRPGFVYAWLKCFGGEKFLLLGTSPRFTDLSKLNDVECHAYVGLADTKVLLGSGGRTLGVQKSVSATGIKYQFAVFWNVSPCSLVVTDILMWSFSW
jgi:hypothetical protein